MFRTPAYSEPVLLGRRRVFLASLTGIAEAAVFSNGRRQSAGGAL